MKKLSKFALRIILKIVLTIVFDDDFDLFE